MDKHTKCKKSVGSTTNMKLTHIQITSRLKLGFSKIQKWTNIQNAKKKCGIHEEYEIDTHYWYSLFGIS